VLARYTAALEKALDGKVTILSKVGRVEGTGELAVIFRPQQSRPNIAQVQFNGNSVIPEDLLINTFAEAAIGVPYTDAEVRRRLDSSVRKLYEARGRLHVSFPKIVVTKAEKVDGVVVNVTVDEGQEYSLKSFAVKGVSTQQAAQMVKLANLSKGDTANFDDVNAALDRIHKHFLGEGYLKVSEKTDRQVDDKEHVVDLAVTIDLGPQYHFGKLKIEGLDILNEPPIRKMWGDREGKPYQDGFPDSFLASIKEQDLFENLAGMRAETKMDDEAKLVDVTLYFKGGKPPEDPAKRRRQPL
jgi:outer membrane protein assembly factor BamA